MFCRRFKGMIKPGMASTMEDAQRVRDRKGNWMVDYLRARRSSPGLKGFFRRNHLAKRKPTHLDEYAGRRTRACKVCYGKGRTDHGEECDWCGGTGRKRECLRADCKEYGCGGYGTCYQPKEES